MANKPKTTNAIGRESKYSHSAPSRNTPKPQNIFLLAQASFSSFVIFFHGLPIIILFVGFRQLKYFNVGYLTAGIYLYRNHKIS